MAKKHPSGWERPSYTYNAKKGLVRHHRGAWAYFLMVGLAMFGAGLIANLQVGQIHKTQPKANVSAQAPKQSAPQPIKQVAATNTPAPLPTEDPKLAAILNNWANSHHQNQWSVDVLGLTADTPSASYNPNVSFNSASIYKVLLTYPLLTKIPRSEWASVQLATGDNQTSLADCVDSMLRVSDNTCGDAVGAYVGWAYADAQLHEIGLANTHLNDPSGPTTTAADASLFMQGLYGGKWFDPGDRAYIMNIMQEQILRSGIPAGCPSCIVADKTGDLGFVRHDTAIVQYGSKAYGLSIFTSGASYGQIAQLTSQIQSYISASAK